MTDKLHALEIARLTGQEPFRLNGKDLPFKTLGFWQWCLSDLVSNATRGILAEYIVARALEIPDEDVRQEWDAFDLLSTEGTKIEVKSSAYLQSWEQSKLSAPSFSIREAAAWDSHSNVLADEKTRPADVYVFALLAHKEKSTVNPLEISQWEFYVLATSQINQLFPLQKSISLGELQKVAGDPVAFADLSGKVADLVSVGSKL